MLHVFEHEEVARREIGIIEAEFGVGSRQFARRNGTPGRRPRCDRQRAEHRARQARLAGAGVTMQHEQVHARPLAEIARTAERFSGNTTKPRRSSEYDLRSGTGVVRPSPVRAVRGSFFRSGSVVIAPRILSIPTVTVKERSANQVNARQ